MRGPLVDTSVAVDHLKGNEDTGRILSDLLAEESHVFMSVLAKIEVYAGTKGAESEAVRRFLELFVSVPVDDDVAELAGKLAWKYRKSSPELGIVDFTIAAQAIHGDFALVTLSPGRYPMLQSTVHPKNGWGISTLEGSSAQEV